MNPSTRLNDKQIDKLADEFVAKQPRPTEGIFVVITYYLALWLIASHGWELFSRLKVLGASSSRGAVYVGDAVVFPLWIAVSILAVLGGIGLFFFREWTRKIVIGVLIASSFLSAYTLFALNTFNPALFSNGLAIYYAIMLLFIPLNAIWFLLYKPTKQLFH